MYNKIRHKKADYSLLSFRWMSMIGAVMIASMLSACSLGTDQKSLCDLKVLSLLIPKQTEQVMASGSIETIKALENSQTKLKDALAVIQKDYSNDKEANQILQDGQEISANIDILVKNGRQINHLYDLRIATMDVIPGIQAEYNLMVDQMARDNYPSTQVVIAKNQVFIAERILRSLTNMMENDEFSRSSMEDFEADLETFNAYLKAQLEGNAELGVNKITAKELRDSLLSIQHDTEEILNASAVNLQKNRDSLMRVFLASQDNISKSEDLFIRINRLETNSH